jgi:peptidoglycan hydrolase-like protein with peptidoglycan-binding domain
MAFAVLIGVPSIASAYSTLTRQLDIKDTGSDVTDVQTYLAKDSTLYPQGLVTGYFGTMTSTAVSRYQTRNGIQSVGRVGPVTLLALNKSMMGASNDEMANGLASPEIYNTSVNTSRNGVNVSWGTDQQAQGLVFYSTSPLQATESLNSVEVSGSTMATDRIFRNSQTVSIANLQSNTTYYYMVYVVNQNGGVSVTWPSTFQTTN